MTVEAEIRQAYDFILAKIDFQPKIGIILGTGLGGLVNEIDVKFEIDYADIPHFPISTVETHSGKLIFGFIGEKPVMAMQGRFHRYEGFSLQKVTFPIRVMHLFDIKHLFISNACGGMDRNLERGDIVVLTDHINLLGDNPLIGPNLDSFGPRFPDMSAPYDLHLIEEAIAISKSNGMKLKKAVYVAVTGPCLETKAEYKFLNNIGADVVGMSTVPEVIVARHQEMKVFAMSVVTDECFPETLKPVNISEIITTAMKAEPSLTKVMSDLIKSID